jgi:uridine monophosphate synthetase
MVKPFFQRLKERAEGANSLLCVGLDPHPDLLPEHTADAVYRFCLRLIKATSDAACAFKPNSAFFEAMGPEGMEALKKVIAAVPEGIPVILDAKRGDIASTARAYADAAFHVLGADAVTANPFLGRDSLEPLLEDDRFGVFMLCKTSNPSADEIQGRTVEGGEPLFIHLAQLAMGWHHPQNLGLVVGATDPLALEAVRSVAPDLWILAPGVGTQGGDLEAALRAGLGPDGLGMLISVSRSIARAQDPGVEAIRLQGAINEMRSQVSEKPKSRLPPLLAAVADGLLEAGCVRFGSFIIKSGIQTPIYIDLRLLASHPELLAKTASAYLPLLRDLHYDRLAAIPYAALPIGTAISLQIGQPLIYPRREVKDYGTKASIEGVYSKGETVLVLDDLVTTGGSKLEAIERLTSAGLVVRDIAVLIDRQSGAAETLSNEGYHLHSVFTLKDLLDHWERAGSVSGGKIAQVRAFLQKEADKT